MRTYGNRGKGDYVTAIICFPYKFFLSKYLLHKLRAIFTRFFVGFVRISALLKISVLRNHISFVFVWFTIILDC